MTSACKTKCRYLTRQEEIEAWLRKCDGDREARDLLIQSVYPFVKKMAARLAIRYGLDIHECQCIGALRLVEIVDGDKYDAMIARLTTYVSRGIKWAIMNHRAQTGIPLSRPNSPPEGALRSVWFDVRTKVEPLPRSDSWHEPFDGRFWRDDGPTIAELRVAVEGLEGGPRRSVHGLLRGKSYKEVAAASGVSHQAIWDGYCRAVKRLKKHFGVSDLPAQSG